MNHVLSWPRSTRRRLFVWTPIALMAATAFLLTAHHSGGPAVLAGIVMITAALGALFDDETTHKTRENG